MKKHPSSGSHRCSPPLMLSLTILLLFSSGLLFVTTIHASDDFDYDYQTTTTTTTTGVDEETKADSFGSSMENKTESIMTMKKVDALLQSDDSFLMLQIDDIVPSSSSMLGSSNDDAAQRRPSSLLAASAPAKSICSSGKLYIDSRTELPKTCSGSRDCPSPYYCDRDTNLGTDGLCCLMVSEQEPPPIGCPYGNRPLKNAQGQILSCNINQPNSCPGNTQCYYDSVEKSYKCCGKDPGEGCPSGSKAVQNVGSTGVQTCLPGDNNQKCSGSALCQWSYLIDRYQCCERDNGCPKGMSPKYTAANTVQTCTRGSTNACGTNGQCEFNFWSASYQCCERDFGQCPSGQVAYLEPNSVVTRTCLVVGQQSTCPLGHTCTGSSTGQNICCGAAGQCPGGLQRVQDSAGRFQACSPTAVNSCTAPATCQASIGGTGGQYICCSSGTSQFTCPSGRQPYPNNISPTRCTQGVASCPTNMFCETTSNGVSICCSNSGSVTTADSCPNGYQFATRQTGVASYCIPTMQNACQESGASCLQSTTRSDRFLCCIPGGQQQNVYTCPVGTPYRIGANYQYCSASNQACTGGATCYPSSNVPAVYICCSTQNPAITTQYTCPASMTPARIGTSYNLCTNTGGISNCPAGSTCQPAMNSVGTFLCCRTTSSTGLYTCPNNAPPLISNGVNRFCLSPSAANQCQTGYQCQPAANALQTYICCSSNLNPVNPVNQYTCPNNQIANVIAGQYQTCTNPGSSIGCSNGYICQQATNQFNKFICCGTGVTNQQPTCSNNAVAKKRDATNVVTCAPSQAAICGTGYACQPSSNMAGTYVCCLVQATNTPTCPNNAAPATTTVGGTIQYCSTAVNNCPAGYTCQTSANLPGTTICCPPTTNPITNTSPQCPVNFKTYLTTYNQPQYCNVRNPINCPSGTVCLPTTGDATRAVCCESGTANTLCPNNRAALILAGGQPQYCTSPSGVCSQSGYTCQVSPTTGRYVCCQSTSVPNQARCANGQVSYQPNQIVYYCDPNNPRINPCPSNYQCSQSMTPSQYVCCLSQQPPVVQTPSSCSTGRPLYMPSGSVIYCSTGVSNVCPSPQSVCDPSNVPGKYVCCGVSNNPNNANAQCPAGWQAELVGGTQPRTCVGLNRPGCGSGYSCAQSTITNTFLCCRYGQGTTLRCYNGANPQLDSNNNNRPLYCNTLSPSCAQGYSCSASTQANTFICCQNTGGATSALRCPNGANPTMVSGQIKYCFNPGQSTGCPSGSTCLQSTRAGFSVCCAGFNANNGNVPANGRCLGRSTYLPNNGPLLCQLPNTCPGNYECSSYTTTGQYYCCSVALNSNAPVCPGGATPYRDRDTQQYFFCSNAAYTCPDGYVCRRQVNSVEDPAQHVCCTAKASCQRGWLPYLDPVANVARTCDPYDQNSCKPPGSPYKCQGSTVPGTYLCCMESMIDMIDEEGINDAVPSGSSNSSVITSGKGTTMPPPTTTTTQSSSEWVWEDGILVKKKDG